MDATRARRTRDQARKRWYAAQRQRRFARFMGVPVDESPRAARRAGRPSAPSTHGD
jgi:hypothetical protein